LDGIFNAIVKWVTEHLSPRYLIVASIITGFMLFGPTRLLVIFGLDALITKYRGWISLVFLASTLLVLTYPLEHLYVEQTTRRRVRKCLLDISGAEANLLRRCLLENGRATYVIAEAGPAKSLEKKGILWPSCERSNALGYNITPLAEAVLKEDQFIAKFTPERGKQEPETYA
jgi:Super-infection exclusion protein B